MLAIRLSYRSAQAAAFATVFLASMLVSREGMAQSETTVTEVDIARAKRIQPTVTERDIEHAQRKYRMPTEQELSRVPIPLPPDLDALPKPATSPPSDLEALAKGYVSNADSMQAAQGTGGGLLIFVSFSMPPATLQRLVEQAARARATLMVRGFVNGSLRETIVQMQKLIGKHQVAFQIDPQAFDRFSIVKTPTFVLVRAGANGLPCGAGLCMPSEAFVATSGDVSVEYALRFIERQTPRFADEARRYLKYIRG